MQTNRQNVDHDMAFGSVVGHSGGVSFTKRQAGSAECVGHASPQALVVEAVHRPPSCVTNLLGPQWADVGGLQLPEEPGELLEAHAAVLNEAWRTVAAGLSADTAARLDDEGRPHAQEVTAIPDPPSLVDLRNRVEAMLPRIDRGELILEVMVRIRSGSATSDR
ncbi:hypothetical protein [Streptomyces cucumeris]|uniref:hypothetical protein n=1 Tax=Streptomyces cucumeris TaxID=2962890 RepID=UPI003D73384A